jgi:hypothetical protein
MSWVLMLALTTPPPPPRQHAKQCVGSMATDKMPTTITPPQMPRLGLVPTPFELSTSACVALQGTGLLPV